MMLRWSVRSQEDLIEIQDYLQPENPKAALEVDDRIRFHTNQLLSFPESGRIGRVQNTRELIIPGTPYILVYRVLSDRVRILRVLHMARNWPTSFED